MKTENITVLEEELDKLERAYWLENNPLAPDQVYNEMKERYRELTGDDRPIGYKGGRTKLPTRMYSLDNVYDEKGFDKWCRNLQKKTPHKLKYIVEPKYDGMSISLLYKRGELQAAYTRGDGEYGEDITDKLPTCIPRSISSPLETIEIRGEVYLTKSILNELRDTYNAMYTNCRQAAVGILRKSDIQFKDKLSFVCFTVGVDTDKHIPVHEAAEYGLVKEFDISYKAYSDYKYHGAFVVSDNICHGRVESLKDIPLDGAVVKIDDSGLRKSVGFTSHHPRWAIAIKTQSKEYETKLTGVEWGLGVQGTLTPVLLVEPVDIDGVIVSRVTGDNATRFNHAGYRIGDSLWIKRSGDVIPKVTHHVSSNKGDGLVSPEICPKCGSSTSFTGAYLRCTNGFMCEGNAQARLLHFVSRDALDLKGFGSAVIEYCISEGLNFGSKLLTYFRNPDNKDSLYATFGKKTADKLISVCMRKSYPLDKVLYALAIPSVGAITAEQIAREVKSLKRFIEVFTADKPPESKTVSDTVLQQIRYWLGHPDVLDELSQLSFLIQTTELETIPESNDKTVCFTGSGDGFDRKMLSQSAIRAGYKVSKTVSKKLDYLVTGKTGSSEAKHQKAIKSGVTVLSVAEWIKKTT